MRDPLSSLHDLRRTHGPAAEAERLRLISAGQRRALGTGRRLARWHDELLYAAAYPDSPAVLAAADAGLLALATSPVPTPIGRDLVNSGIAGTDVEGFFTADILAWMTRVGPDPVMAWDREFAQGADETLSLLLLPSERDALLVPDLSTRTLWRLAAGPRPVSWLMARLNAVAPVEEVRDRLLDGLKLAVRWRLGSASRTLTRFPYRRPFYQAGPLLRQVSLGAELAVPLPRPAASSEQQARTLIDVARATLTARARETDTITWANPEEVELFRLDRGVDVALIGLAPSRRLPVESYFGFVAARNQVPVAYGGGWVFFGRCEIGVNLFPEFRGGESAFLFAQVLRAYRQRFRVAQFLVDPYQFGKDNPEAIQSGAFWFYHRLGFRSTDSGLAATAAAEWTRLQSRSGHATPTSVLRSFTGAPLFLDVAPLEAGATPALTAAFQPVAPDLPSLGLAVTRWIAARHGADRRQAQLESLRQVRRLLAPAARLGTGLEREWVGQLAPLVAMIPDLERWPKSERRRLAAALVAKAGPKERDYALSLQRLPRLRRAWEQAASHRS
jgi:hypothetical protein